MVSVQSVNNSQPAFKGKGKMLPNLAEEAQKAFKAAGKTMNEADKAFLLNKIAESKTNAELPKTAKLFNRLAKNDGEIQNQLLNAVFTSTLAPTMIFINPFVRKTPEQKLKTAMRQPVSAGISCSFSLGATLLINKIMEHAANSGYIAGHDLRMSPSDSMLKKSFKKNLKAAKLQDKLNSKIAGKKITDAQDAFLNKFKPEHMNMVEFIEGKKGKLKAYFGKRNAYIEKFAEVKKQSRKEVFKSLMEANIEDIDYSQLEKGTLKVGKKVFGADELKDIPNMTKKSLEKFVKKFNVHNVEGVNVKDSKAVSEYVEKTFKSVGDNFKSFKKIVNPVIGIPVAVGACYILNAIYPAFRDKFAPPLMKLFGIEPAKKDVAVEGGNK